MYTIRKFNRSDYDYVGAVAVHNADQPNEQITVELLHYYDDKRNPDYLDQRFVVEKATGMDSEARIIATGRVREHQSRYISGKYELSFRIIPEFAADAVRNQIYEYMLAFLGQRTPAPKILDTRVRENWRETVKFWTQHGFVCVLREPISILEVGSYDFSGFADALERVESQSIQIFTMTELQARDSNWLRNYYQLHSLITNDVPSPDQRTQLPFEQWTERTISEPNLIPDANFFALDGQRYVGVSNLWKDPVDDTRLNVGITGVVSSHRRRGIATALKFKAIRYASEHDVDMLATANEENNPMYDLNVALGFKPKPAWLSLRKTLGEQVL